MFDISVPAAAFGVAAVFTTGQICDAQAVMIDPFDGTDLAALVGVPAGVSVAATVRGLTAVPVADALQRRGCIVVNSGGRMGVTIGRGKVVEPCARFYALTNSADGLGRWISAYESPAVVYTMQP